MRKITKIYVHTAADPHGKHATVDQLRRYHVGVRGFSDIGYHYVVDNEGITHTGRPLENPGAHVKGDNTNTIGICMTGNQELNAPSPEQIQSVIGLCASLCKVFGLTSSEVFGHRESEDGKRQGKTCPGKHIDLDRLRKQVGAFLGQL